MADLDFTVRNVAMKGTVGIGRPRAVGERALGGGGIGQCRKLSALTGSPQTGNGVSSLAVGTWGGLGLLAGVQYARRGNRHCEAQSPCLGDTVPESAS